MLFAVSVAFLMVASVGAFVVGGALAGPPPTLAAPLGSAAILPGVQTGSQLRAGPITTNPGTPLQALNNTHDLGAVAPTYPMMFTVGFQMRNSNVLAEMIQAQSTPSSPMFHQWLSLGEERTLFGPDPVAYQDTINYFTSLGFKVQTEGLLSVSFSGTAGQVDGAFGTQIHDVSYGTTGTAAAMNVEPLSLPAAIANSIASLNGLDQRTLAQPASVFDMQAWQDFAQSSGGSTPAGTVPLAAVASDGSPVGNLSTIFNVSNHAFFWIYYYSHSHKAYREDQVITPGSLNYLYNASQLINQGINGDSTGSPIKLAIVMAGGINPTDLEGYGSLAWNNPKQILNRLTAMPVDGSFTTNGTVTWTDGASSEMALDIEFSSTMAPAAHIMPVYGPCLCTNVLDDDYALLESQPNSNLPNIISNSWGESEDAAGTLYGPNWVNDLTMNNYFMLLDGRGSTIIASSGDGGGFDTGSGYLSGSFPATDPYVLGVNGLRLSATDSTGSVFPSSTTYGLVNISIGENPQQEIFYNFPAHVDQATKISAQTYWYVPNSNQTLKNAPAYASGGFDTSYWWNQTWMEHGYTVPNLGRSLGSGVAAEADFNQSIYFDGSMQFFWGGTSFACPTTAGELALIEDYLAHNGHNSYLGDGNGFVYDVANAYYNGNLTLKPFYDVVSIAGVSSNGTSYWGNFGVVNGYELPTAQKMPYTAQGNTTFGDTLPGWDFPTGWGSMIVDNFAYDLNTLESLPAQFMTTNAAGTAYDAGAWDWMVLNHTYTIHVNATSALILSTPTITAVFHGLDGTNTTVNMPYTNTALPSSGLDFTMDTGAAPFSQPGFV
ncbi:MAG TPA: protease pro-enzyme activation domain-containing protein, partial [Thermoplasmata archaeon]|nr:protease pro-enzyme activation domain-containing protein [Thermoplasmata archaeon]